MLSFFSTLPRNVYLLFASQIIAMSGTTLISLTGGIIGAELAPSRTLATLPITALVVGLAVSTIPAAMLMRKIGRKKGFILSGITAVFATLLAAFSLTQGNFYLFCFAVLLLGTNSAFVQQYRFAAVESVPTQMASKAVSIVLMAGIFAGILGPEIGSRTSDIFALPVYAGSFIILAAMYAVACVLLTFIKDTSVHEEEVEENNRPFKSVLVQPIFFIAVLAAAVGFFVMSFIMTASPIHLHTLSHYSLENTAFIIQSHIIAMFLPSLATGILIERFGVFRILLAGLLSLSMTVFLGIQAHSVTGYLMTLVLLGIGWNFLYISSTVLISQSYRHGERFRAQGVNDFIVILCQLTATFLAGKILFSSGWDNLNLITLPVILATFLIFIFNRNHLTYRGGKTAKTRTQE